jgi:four helix bundle protein
MRKTEEDRPFETVAAWQKAIVFMRGCYALARRFPADERFELTQQLKRASLAVSANIAEGYGRWGQKELQYKLSVARGELFESQSELQAAVALGYITEEAARPVLEVGDEVSRLLTTMRQ